MVDSGDEYVDENGQNMKFKNCTNCSRPTKYHPGETGRRCDQEPLEGDELKEYVENLKERLRTEAAAKKNSGPPNNIAPATSASVEANLAGAAGVDPNITAILGSLTQLLTRDRSPAMDAREVSAAAAAAAAKAVSESQAEAAGRAVQLVRSPGQFQQTRVPSFNKGMSVESFCKRLKVWYDSHAHIPIGLRMTSILDSLKDNKEREELKSWIIHNIDDNDDFDLTKQGIFEEFVRKLKEKFQVSNWEQSERIWQQLLEFKAKEEEKTREYLERFNEIESQMKNVGNLVSDVFLANHLIKCANISEHSKQSVLSNINLEDRKTVLADVKKKMETLLPKLNYEDPQTILWNQRQYQGPWNKRGDFYRGGNYPDQNRREGRGSGRGESEDRRRREERDFMSEAEEESRRSRTRTRSRGRQGWEQRGRSRSYGRDSFWGSRERRSSSRRSRREPSSARDVFNCDIEPSHTVFFTETENQAILDSGCPKTVGGKHWLRVYIQSLNQIEKFKNFNPEEVSEKEKFKFGPSQIYESNQAVIIPINIGGEYRKLKMSVVDANIPCLIGRDHMTKWRGKLDFSEKTITIDDKIKMKLKVNSKGHYTVDMFNNEAEIMKICETLFNQNDAEEMSKILEKIHKVTAHKSAEQMVRFVRNSKLYNKNCDKLIQEIVSNCKVCQTFRKSQERPKVSMPKSTEINSVVSLDLKELFSEKKYILYLTCETSHYIRGKVISDKKPETIISAIEEIWVTQGPGWPSRGFYSDNGGEFCNKLLEEYVRKTGCTQRLTPAFSPWSNGGNERNHFSCDVTMKKLRMEDPSMSLEEAVRLSCFWANQQVRRTGFSAHQLMFGKGTSLPGLTDGTSASDSDITYDHIAAILNRHQKTRQLYNQVDTDERIKKMMNSRNREYNTFSFQPGDKVMLKDVDKQIWDEVKVHNQDGNIVVCQKPNGKLISASITRVRPAPEKIIQDTATTNQEQRRIVQEPRRIIQEPRRTDQEQIREQDLQHLQTKVRPKKGARIKFQLKDEEGEFEGKVTQVGKASGTNKNRCWIKCQDDQERSFDFSHDVSEWKNVNMVHFTEEVHKKETSAEMKKKDQQMDQKGTQVLFYAMREDILDDDKKIQDVLVTEIPKKYHKSPEVIEAKETEMSNFIRFEAFEEVNDEGQPRISSRWVVTNKEDHDGMKVRTKARLVVRGFQETEEHRSDSPTLSKESLKILISIATNEDFEIRSLDVKNAFLQGKPIEREVYVEPPADYKKPGKIWRLKKNVYGTDDGTRSFYLSMDESLKKLNCKQITGDSALYTYHGKNNKLQGVLGMHVDDLWTAGSEEFQQKVVKPLKEKYEFGKEETRNFRFTGININQTAAGIEINQQEYCNSIQEINIPDKRNTERELNLEEYKAFRGAVGKLNWLQEATRPDLSFDTLNMSMKTKHATVADVNKMNKIIKKAKDEAEQSKIVYSKIDKFENLKIFGFSDASYKTVDDKTRSVEGRILFLTNGEKSCPIMWKAKKIPRVADSTKTAETLAADKTLDDAIFYARMIREIYTGEKSFKQIPVEMFTDSKPLHESLYSTKQVDRKSIRHVIQIMKDSIERGEAQQFHWIDTKNMLADIFTKDSADSEVIRKVLEQGSLKCVLDQKTRKEQGEECERLSSASNQLVQDKPMYDHDYDIVIS